MSIKKIVLKYLIIGLIFGLAMFDAASAQNIMMEQDVNADTAMPRFGKNRKNFIGSYFGVGVIFGDASDDTSISLKMGNSYAFSYGMYYKYKVSNVYSVVLSGSYRYSKFALEPNSKQTYNRLITNELLGEFANRFNFGKRGDFIGNYLELGISGDVIFNDKSKIKTKTEDPDLLYKSRKLVLVNLGYLEKINYSAHARLGLNKLVITADYRLSDLVNDRVSMNLPPLMLGVRFDIGA